MLPRTQTALNPDVLDTNVLVHAVRGSRTWQRIKDLRNPLMVEPRPNYAVVTEAELRALSLIRKWEQPKIEQANFLLGYFRRIEISTARVIDAYAIIDAYSRDRGITMGKNDLWIAATANVTGGMLITTDKDFEHLHGTLLQRVLIELE